MKAATPPSGIGDLEPSGGKDTVERPGGGQNNELKKGIAIAYSDAEPFAVIGLDGLWLRHLHPT
ncbi:hypothetical protein [Allomuricauda sp. M10]|uniref:hypothetical protein n=1 Tax=Allomuricauda sp. M10 TaxID=2683292 RepID=UPI001D181838|nr:hypothetical protein [Muricauda sp. M10]